MKNNDLLYLSGIISENQYHEGADENDGMELPQFKKMMARLTSKLGEKANTYAPLLRYIAKNKNLFPMFERLVEDLMTMQATTGKNIIKAVGGNKPEEKENK